MSISMFGSGNASLGYALLRFRKSIQLRIYPFFFLTGTMFESHFGCVIGLMNPIRDGNGAGRGQKMGSLPPPRMDFSCPIPAPPRMTGKISCPIPAP